MCTTNCCGVFWSVFLVLAGLFSVAFPWYFDAVHIPGDSLGLVGPCVEVRLIGWNTEYCHQNDATACALRGLPSCPSTRNWRTDCDEAGIDCTKLKRVYDISMGFAVIFLVASTLVMIGFFVRSCSRGPLRKSHSTLHVVVAVAGFLCLIIAVLDFAVNLPKAWPNRDTCDTGKCTSFYGSSDTESLGITTKHVWGPAGWAAAVICLLLSLVSSLLTCKRAREQTPLIGYGYGQVDAVYLHGPGAVSGAPYQPLSAPLTYGQH